MNNSIDLLRIIGSPFDISGTQQPVESEKMYKFAFKNRVGLLYLNALKQEKSLSKLTEEYEELNRRARETVLTAARAAKVFDDAQIPYVLYKTLRSYPATPNDVDIIFLGPGNQFESAKKALREAGYLQDAHSAPLQNLFVDPRGVEVASWDKKGGMYYVDLYLEASADYIIYIRKSELCGNVLRVPCGDEGTANVLNPEVELAALMMHSVFPENTFSLEMFYTICYAFANFQKENIEQFIGFIRRNYLVKPAIASLTITLALHKEAFGNHPGMMLEVVERIGKIHKGERVRLQARGFETPHKYGLNIFAGSVLNKLLDTRALMSFGNQALHMLNPKFALDVFKTIRRKLTQETYVQV